MAAALEVILIVACLMVPLRWLVMRELARMDDAECFRREGVVVVKPEVLDHSGAIGSYAEQPIWATVTFKGMTYGFDRVAPAAQADRVGAGELFLPPGLVYRLQ